MANPVVLDIVQGATFNLTVTWTTTGATPVPQSLAAYRAHMQIRPKIGSATITVDLRSTGTSPAIVLEPSGQVGVVSLTIGADKTTLLNKNSVYDLFLIRLDDPTQAVRLIYGTVTVERAVTFE